MCPKALHVPKLVLHKPSGKSVVFLRGPDGRRVMVYCGPHGSTEAQRRYREVLAEHLAGRAVATKQKPAATPSPWPTVEQLVAAYLLHAQRSPPRRACSPHSRGQNWTWPRAAGHRALRSRLSRRRWP